MIFDKNKIILPVLEPGTASVVDWCTNYTTKPHGIFVEHGTDVGLG